MMEKLGDVLLLGLRRGRDGRGDGGAHRRRPSAISGRDVVDLVGGKVSSSMAWSGERARKRSVLCRREAIGR